MMGAADETLIGMLGYEVGTLVVVDRAKESKANQATWVVECRHCKVRFDVPGYKLRHRKIGGCKACGKHPNFRGHGDIYGNYWTKLRANAFDRGLEFSVSIEDAWKLFLAKSGKCALSGLPIVFERSKGRAAEKTASLDRIDSSKGYVTGNVQWVHKELNKLKGKFDEARFIQLCKLVAEHHKDG